MKRKKVLILGKLPPPYMGPSIATEIILKSRLNENFELIHLDTKTNHTIASFGKWKISKIWNNMAIYFRMMRILSSQKPDLVLIPISQTTTGFVKDSFFILIARLYGRKILLQLRGSNFKKWIDGASGLTKSWVRMNLGKTKGIIVLGNKLRYLFEGYFNAGQIFVVPNGGDYTIPVRTENKELRILYLSNLLASKGVEDVCLALEMLGKETAVDFSADLVGAWHNESDKKRCLEILSRNKNLKVRIHAPKGREEKFQFLGNADIFVFPPREPEGHPWALVEAMAAGLPIISTDQGAITESVLDGQNGFIVAPANATGIAGKMKLLAENAELRKKMGNESRNLYLANFTEAKMVERFTTVFNTLLEQ